MRVACCSSSKSELDSRIFSLKPWRIFKYFFLWALSGGVLTIGIVSSYLYDLYEGLDGCSVRGMAGGASLCGLLMLANDILKVLEMRRKKS